MVKAAVVPSAWNVIDIVAEPPAATLSVPTITLGAARALAEFNKISVKMELHIILDIINPSFVIEYLYFLFNIG